MLGGLQRRGHALRGRGVRGRPLETNPKPNSTQTKPHRYVLGLTASRDGKELLRKEPRLVEAVVKLTGAAAH